MENIFPSDTLESMTEKYAAETGICIDSLCFIFDGRRLENDKTLSNYAISNCSVIFVVLRLRGGEGSKFVDATKGQLVDYEWNENAPEWRVCTKGLSIAGRCENEICVAYSEMVIANIGMNDFDLIADAGECACPMCAEKIVPILPGFNTCYWCVKAVKHGEENEIFSSGWTRTGDNYCTYDEHGSGSAEFSRLKIFVRKLHPTKGAFAYVTAPCT